MTNSSQQNSSQPSPAADHSYIRRVLIFLGLAALAGMVFTVFFYAADFFLLLFAAVLIAILLRSFGNVLSRLLNIPSNKATGLAILIIFMLTVLGIFLSAPVISNQIKQLSQDLPQSFDQAKDQLMQHDWFQRSLYIIQRQNLWPSQRILLGKTAPIAGSFLGALGSFLVIVIIGILFALDPGSYWNGIVRLIPPSKRVLITEAAQRTETALRRWLIGIFIDMAILGALTTVGLLFLSVPLALLLGIIAGLLNFIPTLGPVISAIPAVLFAFTEDPQKALYVIFLYIGVQSLESYILTPFVMRQTVHLPPALVLISQILFGILFGFLGLALATPLCTTAAVLVDVFYVKDVLKEQPAVNR